MQNMLQILDFLGVAVFAVSGAIAASRLKLDVFAFVVFATFTGIGGGTLRDLVLDTPVFWVHDQSYLVVCLLVGVAMWFLAHIGEKWGKPLRWADAVGLACYCVMGAAKTLSLTGQPVVAILLGVATACFGGVIRDTIAGQPSAIVKSEIYLTAAFVGAAGYVALRYAGLSSWPAAGVGAALAFILRGGSIQFGWTLPGYRAPEA